MDSVLLPKRVEDAYHICEKTSAPKFLGFLTPSETAVAENVLRRLHASYRFFGGFIGAERVILALLPSWCEDAPYPITPLTFKYRECDVLSHRDFLGSLMALGIARETIGDILVEKGRAVAFVSRDIVRFITENITKVGNVGVEISEGYHEPLPSMSERVQLTDTVASVRLDCIIAALCNQSRNSANERIVSGEISVNSVECTRPTRNILSGDIITVRHRGRFYIDSVDELSKKGRVILKYSKFI